MSIVLKADNRVLTTNAKYSYTIDNYNAASATLYVTNTEGIAVNKFVLIGNFGSESAEILKIASVTPATGAITFKDSVGAAATTRFAHSESTKVSVIQYNQVRFFHNTTSIYSGSTPLGTALDIQASGWFTSYEDTANTTGYGFFSFYDQANDLYSTPSNAIPYTDFEDNTTKAVIDSFFSLLNNKELKLITSKEALVWLNEGYSMARNRLNLVNTEYGATVTTALTITAGVTEYLLPTDFSDLVSITDEQNFPVEFMKLGDINNYTMQVPRYYLRGHYIGFTPTPVASVTYRYCYTTKAPKITSYSDVIDLPNDAHLKLKDFMMFRAYQKLKYPNAMDYFKIFDNDLGTMNTDAIKRSANQDTWGSTSYSLA